MRLLCPWDSAGKNAGSGLLWTPPGDPPDPGTEPESSAAPALQEDSTTEPPVKPLTWHMDAPFETTCPSLLCTKSLTGCKQGWCVQLLGPALKRKQFTLYFLFPRLRGIHLDTVVVSQLWLCGRGQYPTGENKNIGGSLEDHQAHNTGLLSVGLSQEWEINFLL